VQVALNDVAVHAEASDVTVVVEFVGARVALLVQNDGRGFSRSSSTGENLIAKTRPCVDFLPHVHHGVNPLRVTSISSQ
jgi:hypothetical protein